MTFMDGTRVTKRRNIYTLCLKKVPTFELSVTYQILTHFQNFCTTGKRMKFATKLI